VGAVVVAGDVVGVPAKPMSPIVTSAPVSGSVPRTTSAVEPVVAGAAGVVGAAVVSGVAGVAGAVPSPRSASVTALPSSSVPTTVVESAEAS
jgi:hypothetical protein